MTWEQFVSEYAWAHEISKAAARKQLKEVFDFLRSKTLVSEFIPVPGFGKFKRVHKKARKVKVPVTGVGPEGENKVEFREHTLVEGYKVVFLPAPALKHIGV